MPRFIQGTRRGLIVPLCALGLAVATLVVDAEQDAQQPPPQPAAQAPAPGGQPAGAPAQGAPAAGQPAARPAAPPAPAPGTPPKPVTPLAASTLASNPDQFMGEYVSVTAPVDALLTKHAITLDQDKAKSTGKDVLVLMKHVSAPVELNTYVTAIGELMKLEPEAVEKKSKEHAAVLTPEVLAKYRGRPVILAASVVNAAGIDATRRLPPPLTAEEEAFQKIMKEVGSAQGVLRKAVEGSDAKMAAESSATLKRTFMQTEVFFRGKKRADASGWAADARKVAESIERSAAAGKWDEVKTHAGSIGKTCQTCHTAYRERFDDGSYRIKWPASTSQK